jgi:LysM repeat protein
MMAQKMTIPQYIETYKDIAIREMNTYGIPASITLAQGILESSSGNSPLAKTANNHFGIKCKTDWKGETYIQDDDEKNECFRKYKTVLESYEDHSKFLKERQRYAFLFDLPRNDYKAWAQGLKQAGYATNPNYPQLLIRYIEEHKLHQYDEAIAQKIDQEIKITPSPKEKNTYKINEQAEVSIGGKRTVKFYNNTPYVIAKSGDDVAQLAKELEMFEWQIYKYNDMKKGSIISAGDRIYTKPKRRKSDVASYTPKQGETYTEISQRFGIKRSRILLLNNIEENTSDLVQPARPLNLR